MSEFFISLNLLHTRIWIFYYALNNVCFLKYTFIYTTYVYFVSIVLN